MIPIIHGAVPTPHGVGKQARLQDLKSPCRAVVNPVADSYHVFPLPILFAWSTLSVEPAVGATCSVSFTISAPEAIANDTAIWHDWEHGSIGDAGFYVWENPWLAVRIDCTGPTRVEIATKY